MSASLLEEEKGRLEQPEIELAATVYSREGTMNRNSALRLAVSVAVVVVLVALGKLWVEWLQGRHYIGLSVDLAEPGIAVQEVTRGQPADVAGFLPGDVMTHVAGEPIASFDDLYEKILSLSSGMPAEFTVLREDGSHLLTATPGIPPPWFRWFANLLVAFAYLSVGAIALVQSPADQRARLLFGFSALVSLESVWPQSIELVPTLDILGAALIFLNRGLQMGVELHLASVVPVRHGWFETRRWLTPLYYGIGLAFAIVAGTIWILGLSGPWGHLPWLGPAFAGIQSWGLAFWAAGVVVILLFQIKASESPRQRHQGTLVLLGVLPWAAAMGVGLISFVFFTPYPWWLDNVMPVLLLIYPIAVFIAISRYKLLDIELAVKRSLVFGVVSAGLGALFIAVAAGTGLLLEGRIGALPELWMVSLSMLALGLAFAPLRAVARRFVDRRFFPERVEMRARLGELAERLPAAGSLKAMCDELVREIGEILGLRSATLLLVDPGSDVATPIASTAVDVETCFGRSFLVAGDDPGLVMLGKNRRPAPASKICAAGGELADLLETYDAESAVALSRGSRIVGVLLLGARRDRERLTVYEQELVGFAASALALAIENARLMHVATYDGLTGLLRRERIVEVLAEELRRANRYRRSLALFVVDIDRFKRVNDSHGHLTGDAVLRRIARTLKDELRSADAIGRYGGEEFLVVLPEADCDGAVRLAEKLRRKIEDLEEPADAARKSIVTISIGVAAVEPTDAAFSPDELIASADECLLQAKEAGRNRVKPEPGPVNSQLVQ